MAILDDTHVPALLVAFDLGAWGRLSDGPVASGKLGSIWRLETEHGSWAVKLVDNPSGSDLLEIQEGAEFQEAARAAGVPTPEVRRTTGGVVVADVGSADVRVQAWVDLETPDIDLDPVVLGRLLAGLHQVPFTGSIGIDPWYAAPVGADRWAELTAELGRRDAPFADGLTDLMPEMIELEGLLGEAPRALRTCHRDLWADNLRRTPTGGLCVFDFDNAGLADPSQELALVLVEYASTAPTRARALRTAYADAGGPGRIERPEDFAMPIAQLHHIVEVGCRRWLAAKTDAERADNEAWVREFLDRPLTSRIVRALLRN